MNSKQNASSLAPWLKQKNPVKLDSGIKNLIFDLGGVIIDLSIEDTLKIFATLAGKDLDTIRRFYNSAPEFISYEIGGMTDTAFRQFINQHCSEPRVDAILDQCWNGMLRGLPKVKLDLLLSLKKKYNVFLLSNTNAIHIRHINEVMLPAIPGALPKLDDYFHRAYYSHVMKKRKPNADIFEEVLAESNLKASETLFLDDNYDNIIGAGKVGIKTALVDTPDYILNYFNEA